MTSFIRRPATTAEVNEHPYTLASITRCDSPIEQDDRAWHCYVIAQGDNRIVGHRPGSAESVRMGAEELVEKLNDRRTVRSGRVNLKIGPSRKQPSS